MSTAPTTEARQPQNRRVKRRLALISVLVALYPPLVVVASALLLPLAHQQDVQICRTLSTPSGITKQYCEIHNTSPLFGVVSVLTFLVFPAILATLVSGHLALYHLQPADGAKSQRIFAIIGLVLGYTWAAFAVYVWVSLAGAE